MATYQERLIRARTHAGFDQSELARKVGVSPQAIQHLEDEKKKVKGSKYTAAIARECGVNADWLAEERGPMLDTTNVVSMRSRNKRPAPEEIEIPAWNARAAAGPGAQRPETDIQVSSMRLPMEWVRKNIVCTSPANLHVVTAWGDSMVGSFDDGDIIFVDVGIRQIESDGVYVVDIRGQLYIKRFERRPLESAVYMRSDNRAKHPEPHVITEKNAQEVQVLGRAVWVWNGRKL